MHPGGANVDALNQSNATREVFMQDQTYLTVCNTLASYFEVSPTHVKPDQRLRDDWGLDPAELNTLTLKIEAAEDVEIRPSDLENVETVGQLIALVRAIRRRNELAEEITLVVERRDPAERKLKTLSTRLRAGGT
jgi:acyl carrier protein